MNAIFENTINFTPGFKVEKQQKESALYFIFHEQDILLRVIDDSPGIPDGDIPNELTINEAEIFYFGQLN